MNAITRSEDAEWMKYLKDRKTDHDKTALKKVLSSKEGRWFYTRILEMTGYKSQSFTGNSQTFFLEGKRAIGIQLAGMIVSLLGEDGLKLQQKAELEYVAYQNKEKKLYSMKEET